MASRCNLIIVAVLLTCACAGDTTPDDGSWVHTRETVGSTTTVTTISGSLWDSPIELVEELSIGVDIGEDAYMFGSVTGIWATEDQVYVVDSQVPTVRAYDSRTGEYVRTIGTQGQGPGEYTRPASVYVDSNGRVYVSDFTGGGSAARINVYEAEGAVVETWQMPQYTSASRIVVGADSSLWARVTVRPEEESAALFIPARTGMQRVTSEGAIGEPVFPPEFDYERPSLMMEIQGVEFPIASIPHTPEVLWTLSPSGAMIAGLNDDYQFGIYNADGTTTVVRKSWDPTPVSADEAAFDKARLTANMRRSNPDWEWDGPPMPSSRPPYRAFWPDRTGWVMVTVSAPSVIEPDCDQEIEGRVWPCWKERFRWELFNLEGEYLGEVLRPDVLYGPLYAWHLDGDYMWFSSEDELGVRSVKRFRLARPAS